MQDKLRSLWEDTRLRTLFGGTFVFLTVFMASVYWFKGSEEAFETLKRVYLELIPVVSIGAYKLMEHHASKDKKE